ncbi:PP2C family protein-serine/threonine phosphatase [Isoptericola sp. NPDC057191]|uniref:PP2C family protein-serine/threonine phosphatase n=1 Tax=Isoptericola sp. NPDC057191 TaxID=3346041 RepID=UPI0036321B3B
MTVETSESARVLALERLGVLDTDPEERFDRVTRLTQRLFGVPMASVTMVDTDRQWRKSFVGLDGPVAQREGAFCDVTIRASRTLVVEDAAADPQFADNPFVQGDPHLRFYAGHPLEAPGGERVGTLCVLDVVPHEFTDADRGVLRDLALWVQGELQRDAELDRAGEVQRGLLPRLPPDLDGYRVAARCLPARGVGGDFYDWSAVPGGTAFVLADVMGKGMAAAIVAASARAALRTGVRDPDLPRGVAEADEALTADLEGTSTFVTAWCGVLDPPTGALTSVDAGHGIVTLLHADGRRERLAGDGLPLGVLPEMTRGVRTATLGRGDRLVVASDGLVDLLASLGLPGGDPTALTPDERPPGPHGAELQQLARDVVQAPDAQATLDAFLAVAAGRYLPDDLTVLVVERAA